jgi:hypothetical protein
LALSTESEGNICCDENIETYRSCQIWLDKLKDAPKIGELESHLAAKIIEQDALKKQVERLQLEKQNENHAMQQKYEQDMNAMREQMNQILSLIQQNPVLANIKPEVLIKKKTA